MREPFTQLYFHLVWATWERQPFLVGETKTKIYQALQAECVALKAEVLGIGGIEDHVHLLVRFPATISLSEFIKRIKGSSSHLITHQGDGETVFKWQEGYGAFTLSKGNVPKVLNYIASQEEHHRSQTTHAIMERCSRN